ncbi:MAG: hypothetical protein JF606_17225 [Burkholderiales bacterium]|nr:hypothetical protein [Burkholderiales bacterium]
MANRTLTCLSFLTVALASPLSFAEGDGFRNLNNEAGTEFIGNSGMLSREEVKLDRAAHRSDSRVSEASPAPLDSSVRAGFAQSREEVRQAAAIRDRAAMSSGWRNIGGEAGWVFEGR